MKTLILLILLVGPSLHAEESEFQQAVKNSTECSVDSDCESGYICSGYKPEQTFEDSIPDMNMFGPRTYPESMGICATQAQLEAINEDL